MDKSMFGVYLSLTICLQLVAGSECDLAPVQDCIGSASDLLPQIYFNPTSSALLGDIKENICGNNIEKCLEYEYGNCSGNSLAPYKTLINTITLVCRTDLVSSACLARDDVQHAFTFCFEMFKVVVYNVVDDAFLTSDEVNHGLCVAFANVKSCTLDAAYTACDARAQAYIATLLGTTTRANREVLGC